MILLLVILLLAIVIGALFGELVTQDPGYVLLSYGDTALETSLWVALLLLVASYFIVRLIIWGVRSLTRGQVVYGRWRTGRRLRNARQQTIRGLLLMAEGRWQEAKKTFLQGVAHIETPLINYLNAARAAHELGQPAERDAYLKRAHETTPGAKFAALLTQAEFQMNDSNYEQALATLLNLQKRAPKHTAVRVMLARCYAALQDWQACKPYLRELAEEKLLPQDELRQWSRQVWQDELRGARDIAKVWKQLPKPLKEDVSLLKAWADDLVLDHRSDDAEAALRLALNQIWSAELVERYGYLDSGDTQRQLLTTQDWAKSRPSDVDLLVAQGRLSLRASEFEKARDLFETALRIEPRDDIYGELGRLCIALGDERRGTDYLLKAQGGLPALPLPKQPAMRSSNAYQA